MVKNKEFGAVRHDLPDPGSGGARSFRLTTDLNQTNCRIFICFFPHRQQQAEVDHEAKPIPELLLEGKRVSFKTFTSWGMFDLLPSRPLMGVQMLKRQQRHPANGSGGTR